jgi:hypothetical protein
MSIEDTIILLFKINHLVLIYIKIGIHLNKNLIESFDNSFISVLILCFLFDQVFILILKSFEFMLDFF